MKKINIAIDGYSSTGKSTVAKALAKHLGYIYVDTGAMYRAVTYYAMSHDFISDKKFDKTGLTEALSEITLEFRVISESDQQHIFLNGQDVEHLIRGIEVSSFVSDIASLNTVRTKLVKQQQQMGKSKGVVMDGRDIGTVVFPDAELKLFMTATAQIRAERRYKELKAKDENIQLEDVVKNIELRDHKDTTRADSPLKQAEDAIVIDNSTLNHDQQLNKIIRLAEEKIIENSQR